MLRKGLPAVGTTRDITDGQVLAAVSTPPGSYSEATFHCWDPGDCGRLFHSVALRTVTGAVSMVPLTW